VKFSINRSHLLEFIFVFAAVALGFFAENLREYYSNKAREREFIQLLVENLEADSLVFMKRDSALRERVVWMDTLVSLISGTNTSRNAEIYLLARYSTRVIQGKPGSSILNYLARSGEYMSIDNFSVKDNIQQYESKLIWLEGLTKLEEEQAKTLWPIIPAVFDTRVFMKMRVINASGTKFEMPAGNPPLLSRDPMVLNHLAYMLYLRRSQFSSQLINHMNIDKDRRDLIKLLQREYEL
jgi:hypothetical protein